MISKTDFQSFVPLNWHFKNLSTLLINEMSRYYAHKKSLKPGSSNLHECLYPNCTCQLFISAVKKTLFKNSPENNANLHFWSKINFQKCDFPYEECVQKIFQTVFLLFFIQMARDFQGKTATTSRFSYKPKAFRFV